MPTPPPALNALAATAVRVLSNRIVRIGFVAVAAGLCVWAVAREWGEIKQAVARLDAPVLIAALAVVIASLVVSMVLWRLLLAGLGSPLPYRVAARVLYVGQLGKYIPGAVWPVVAQMEMGSDYGVPRRRSVTGFALLMLFTFTGALLVAAGALPSAAGAGPEAFRWAFALTPVVLVLIHPRILNPLLDRLLRLARRPPLESPLRFGLVVRSLATGMAQWLIYGVHIWLLGVALGADPVSLAPLAIGGFALAWCVGYLGVITPAGLGVREVALVAVLLPELGRADAIVVALASRTLITLADLILAAAGALSLHTMRPTELRTRPHVPLQK